MNAFKVTYTDGSSYITSANGTLAEFTAYLMQFGGVVTSENPATGEETRHYIDKIEQVTSEQAEDERPKYDYQVKRADGTIVNAGTDNHSWFTIEQARAIKQDGDTILYKSFLETL